ncbi:phosphoribosyltransferase-like protein [Pseudoxanthomonas putridarboris]|uniref:Uncharacterized protein n=1 Tax=Pseudoxanthomonas putridarboris TaxID=752605 RepID=A0ABU9IXF1_9GAMM
MSLLGTSAASLWLQQFRDEREHVLAREMLGKFRLVTHSELDTGLSQALLDLAKNEVVAVFVERAIPKRSIVKRVTCPARTSNGHANVGKPVTYSYRVTAPAKMYKEAKVKMPGDKKSRLRAKGAALAPVDAPRRDQQEVGSEGILATIATGAARGSHGRLLVHPSAEEMRKSQVRRVVILTDFIGSATRVRSMLQSLWRVRTIRAWHNLGLIRFCIVAFSATKRGAKLVRSLRTKPDLIVVSGCPTIATAFKGSKREAVRGLCRRRSPSAKRALGFGDAEVLMAFEHSCPNNAPAIFIEESKRKSDPWFPLFPARRTRDVFTQGLRMRRQDRVRLALEALKFSGIAQSKPFRRSDESRQNGVIVLAALRQGRRDISELAGTTGLSVQDLGQALERIQADGLADPQCRLTPQGHGLLRDLSRPPRPGPKPIAAGNPVGYHPKQLRSPVSRV